MKIAVIGGRDFNNDTLLNNTMDTYKSKISVLVSGGARGADSMGENWAKRNNIPTDIYIPNWNKFGKSAGFIRNKDIINNCDIVIAFWDGKSKGTANSIAIAKDLDKEIIIIKY